MDISPSTPSNATCEPFGKCERCPEEELLEPFCQPFGNRQLLHCHTPGSTGEIPAWGSCGRIIHQERIDFFEFASCNAVFAVIGLLVIMFRLRHSAYERSRRLARRIGTLRYPRP